MLYEIISPDAFLRPFIDDYTTLSSIYAVVRNAYAKKVYIDRAFQKKTNALVQEHIGIDQLRNVSEFLKIDADTVELIKKQKGGEGTRVINLIKSIEKTAEENTDDPFLIAMAERPKAIQELFEDRMGRWLDVKVRALAVRPMRNKWASCSTAGPELQLRASFPRS